MKTSTKRSAPRPVIGIIMGSTSDLPVMQAAVDLLAEFAVPHEVAIVSAHRTPQRMYDYAQSATERGLQVIIAGAGGAAHLPGMTASLTILPVIGVPIAATVLNGTDALLSIAQMPAGVPVATVAINNAANAALLALQILALNDARLRTRLQQYKQQLAEKVLTARPGVTRARKQK
jgi:5-(carboxyamino)imidazole ribonucleotide mutase